VSLLLSGEVEQAQAGWDYFSFFFFFAGGGE